MKVDISNLLSRFPSSTVPRAHQITIAATAAPLSATSLVCQSIILKPATGNSGTIYWGEFDVQAGLGMPISAGDIIPGPIDANDVYVIGTDSDILDYVCLSDTYSRNRIKIETDMGFDNHLNGPRQISYYGGVFWVSDYNSGNLRLQEVSEDLSEWQPLNVNMRCSGIDFDGTNYYFSQNLTQHYVRKLDTDFSVISNYALPYPGPVDAGATLHVFVIRYKYGETDCGFVKLLKSDMSSAGSVLSYGTGDGQFQDPKGIKYYDGKVYVAGDNRIQVFNADTLAYESQIAITGAMDLDTDGTNWFVQTATQTIKYDMSFTDGTKVAVDQVGYSIALGTNNIAITDNLNHHIILRTKSNLYLVDTGGQYGDGTGVLFSPVVSGAACSWTVDGQTIPVSDGANISYRGYSGYKFKTAGPNIATCNVEVDNVTNIDITNDDVVSVLPSDVFEITGSWYDGDDDFSIVLIPDTQYLSMSYPEVFEAIPPWLAINKEALNIKAVVGLGDVVADPVAYQWAVGAANWEAIRDLNIIAMPTIGNHDYDDEDPLARAATGFLTYFGESFFADKSWFVGDLGGNTLNYYTMFTVQSVDYIILSLNLWPTDAELAWANGVIAANPTKKFIIETHGYLANSSGLLMVGDDPMGPPAASEFNDAQEMWDKCFSLHENVLMVVCGHRDGSSYLAGTGINGNTVHQMGWDRNGGSDGLHNIVIVTFSPRSGSFRTSVFSPYTGGDTWHIGKYVKSL
jgi:hypothetical protein